MSWEDRHGRPTSGRTEDERGPLIRIRKGHLLGRYIVAFHTPAIRSQLHNEAQDTTESGLFLVHYRDVENVALMVRTAQLAKSDSLGGALPAQNTGVKSVYK